MSQKGDRSLQHGRSGAHADDFGPLSAERALKAHRSGSKFRGPAESLDEVDTNEYIALLRESREEQFAAGVSFVRRGIERGVGTTFYFSLPGAA